MSRRHVKTAPGGVALLNVGCGPHTHNDWTNLDFSEYAWLRKRPVLARFLRRVHILSETRYSLLQKLDPEIIRWDVYRGLPFPDLSFDVVYNSHFLGHLDRESVPAFLRECFRVIKPGGFIRIVVPDLERLASRYMNSLRDLRRDGPPAVENHARSIEDLFELMVRTTPRGTSLQNPLVRLLERLIRGPIEKRGERLRWQYDFFSLKERLAAAGFRDVRRCDYNSSRIPDWNRFLLDMREDGTPYKENSLYIEARKSPPL